jgi:hypothetical protein
LKDTVLIVSREDDIHAKVVANEIQTVLGARPIILDSAQYPNQWSLSFAAGTEVPSDFQIHLGSQTVSAAQVAGVWWRRPGTHRISGLITDQPVRSFCVREAQAAFEGWIYSLGDAVINPLIAENSACRKPLQLKQAAAVELTIPRTLITNSENDARRFYVENQERVVFKILTNVNWQFAETRHLRKEDLGQLGLLTYAPVIFQEEIVDKTDIRVTVVDQQVFAVSIHPRHAGAKLDWRLDAGAEIRPHVLPAAVVNKILRLQQVLGLRYSAIDLALTSDGEYVFFEVNTGGQFLFAEIHGGQQIASALAGALVSGRPTVSCH